MPVVAQTQVDQIEPRAAAGIQRNPAQGGRRVPDQGKDLRGWDRHVVEQRRLRHRVVAGRIIEWHLPLVRPVDEDRRPGKGIAVRRLGEPLVATPGRLAAGQCYVAGAARGHGADDALGGP